MSQHAVLTPAFTAFDGTAISRTSLPVALVIFNFTSLGLLFTK
jgi:hypothetical protein